VQHVFSSRLAAEQDLIDSRIILYKLHEVNNFQSITVIVNYMLLIILALIMGGEEGKSFRSVWINIYSMTTAGF